MDTCHHVLLMDGSYAMITNVLYSMFFRKKLVGWRKKLSSLNDLY